MTQTCLIQLGQFAASLKKKDTWALQVIDSFGKPQSGIFWGSLTWAGEYRECINITSNEWKGKHCLIGQQTQNNMPTVVINKAPVFNRF